MQVEEGNVGFLFLQGGVMARLEGPAALKLVESHRLVDAPSVLQGLLGQRVGVDPLGGTKVRTALALQVLSGTVAVKTGVARANVSVKLYAANVYGHIEGATLLATVRPDGEVWWDTLEGAPTVGMVSGPPGGEASIVIPSAPQGIRLVTQAPSLASPSADAYGRLDASMKEMVDSIRRGEGGLKAGGVEYQELSDPTGLSYLASKTEETPQPQEVFETGASEAPPAEEVVAVPGLEVRLLTDADIQTMLPAGMGVHVLPGNTLRLTVGGNPLHGASGRGSGTPGAAGAAPGH